MTATTTIQATLASWGNFYEVTGAAAAALTGLQFIVQTLLASNALPRGRLARPRGNGSFFTLGAATLPLLCIEIHNAWDTVTYLTIATLKGP